MTPFFKVQKIMDITWINKNVRNIKTAINSVYQLKYIFQAQDNEIWYRI